MFPMKHTEAAVCLGYCSPYENYPCGSTNCRCLPIARFIGSCAYSSEHASVAKMIEEHPNLCQSNDECMKKGSGNFCARYPNSNIDYGWCLDSDKH
ncbi:hypothetical protein CR513_16922, partial [Mucuna pruriens]